MGSEKSTSAETRQNFRPLDWLLSICMALAWGSAFLLIDIAIRDFHTAVVPFGRTFFGAAALLMIPSARERIARQHWPRLIALGFVWMALPFLLFPLAEQTVSSSIAGMMNGALPVVVAVVTAVWVRSLPSGRRIFAVLVGFAGIALIALPSIDDGASADIKGIALLLLALLSYAVALNLARPLLAIYGSATLMLNVAVVACAISLPYGIWGIKHSTFSFGSLAAVAVLGVVGTGFAFVLFAILSKRTGTVRSMIPIYFTPIVGTILGISFNDEKLIGLSVLGMLVVVVGAWLTSRPEVGAISNVATNTPTPIN